MLFPLLVPLLFLVNSNQSDFPDTTVLDFLFCFIVFCFRFLSEADLGSNLLVIL